MANPAVRQFDSGVAYPAANPSLTFTEAVLAGSALVACFMAPLSDTPTVSDTVNGNWTGANVVSYSQSNYSAVFKMWVFIFFGSAAGTPTVQTAGIAAGGSFASICEVTGVTAVDQENQSTGNASGTTYTTAAITTKFANSVILAFGGSGSSPSTAEPVPVSPLVSLNSSQIASYIGSGSQTVTSIQTGYTAAFTMASGDTGCGNIILNLVTPTYSISGSAGVAGATVSWTGTSSGSTTADGSGNYTIPGLVNGSYAITPSLAGYTFSPTSANETVSGSNITGVNFTATPVVTVYSVPDCRDTNGWPNNSVNVQGTLQYTVQKHESRAAGAPIDSRVNKPVDSRKSPNIPENSRTQPPFES